MHFKPRLTVIFPLAALLWTCLQLWGGSAYQNTFFGALRPYTARPSQARSH